MKIRRKLPKASRSSRPLYIVGYSSDPLAPSYLQAWFDLEYGGPLRYTRQPTDTTHARQDAAEVLATHGPWSALFRVALNEAEATAWKDRLNWRHPYAGQVVPTSTTPAHVCDHVLHAARLARGLTLLSEGTAYDLVTQTYLNPSDWQDLTLSEFHTKDHVVVSQGDTDRPNEEWFYTLGLSKFGRDELETFQPVGLPGQPVLERLGDIAAELNRLGSQPKVGQTLAFSDIGLSVSFLGHRTAQLGGLAVPLREIRWVKTIA